jgi:hypothetical protein
MRGFCFVAVRSFALGSSQQQSAAIGLMIELQESPLAVRYFQACQ